MSILPKGSIGAALNTANLSLTIPGTVQPGDIMLIFFSYQTSGTTVTNPSGWTAIGTDTTRAQAVKGWWRIADGSYGAGSTVTVTTNAAAKNSLEFVSYSGVDDVSPFLVSIPYAPGTTANSWTMPNTSPAEAGWRVDFLGQRSSSPATSWTVPGGMTRRDQQFNTGSGASYAVVADSNGDVGPGTITGLTYSNNGSATAAFAGWTVVLKPKSDTPPPAESVLKVWDGSDWVERPVQFWDGTSWVTASVKVWNGTDWV